MTGNIVTFKVHDLMYVVLSKAEKHVPYVELVGTTECVTLQPRSHTNCGHYNRVQLCIVYQCTITANIFIF